VRPAYFVPETKKLDDLLARSAEAIAYGHRGGMNMVRLLVWSL